MSLSVGGERERNELAANDMERMRKRKDVRGVDRVEILQQMPLLNVPVYKPPRSVLPLNILSQ